MPTKFLHVLHLVPPLCGTWTLERDLGTNAAVGALSLQCTPRALLKGGHPSVTFPGVSAVYSQEHMDRNRMKKVAT